MAYIANAETNHSKKPIFIIISFTIKPIGI